MDRAQTYLLEFVEGSEVLRDPLATQHDRQFTPHDEKGPFLPLHNRTPAELIDPTNGALHPHAASVSAHSSRTSCSDYDDLLRKPKHSVTIDLSSVEVMVGVDPSHDQRMRHCMERHSLHGGH